MDYIVAHGIATYVGEERVVIGSHHFVFEDEKCTLPEDGKEKFENLPENCSHLYMAIGGQLAAVICIEDPLREEAPSVIRQLKEAGFKRIVMMTGDSERMSALEQADELVAADAPVIPLTYPLQVIAAGEAADGLIIDPQGYLNVEGMTAGEE